MSNEDRAVKFLLTLIFVIVFLVVMLALADPAGAQDPEPQTPPVYDYELHLGDRPLDYLDLAGNSCQIGVLEGFYDSWYPDKWHCHGWTACEPHWFPHGFSLSGTATYPGDEDMPSIYCGKPEDHTLYLNEGMVTFLEHNTFFPIVANE